MQGCPDDNALVAMADQALGTAQFAAIEQHIDSCEHCRKIVAAAIASKSLALGTPKPPSSEDVVETLAAQLDVSISDRYVIEAVLGKGGMGTVYLAHDRTLGRDVALKLHHRSGAAPEWSEAGERRREGGERLRREAQAMAKLAHPNVVTVYEVATVDDRLYVAMEYVRGETLRGWLAQKQRDWRDVLALLCEAGQGLAAAHAAGLIHRDFKPENVLVGDDGRPRVGDFGLARVGPAPSIPVVSVELAETALTQAGTVLGTPAYMAPEQLGGDAVDARCDQFAFCVVAWECLYGKRPFTGIDRQTRVEAPRREVPLRVRRVIERGLAVEPGDRYADMPALISALRKAARPKTKQWIATVLLGTAVIGAAGYAGVGAWKHRQHEAACQLEGARIASLVGPETQLAIRMRFLATRSPMADSAFEHSIAVLDPYAKSLATSTTQTCLNIDDPLHAAREHCLAARTKRLSMIATMFESADASGVSRAASSAWAISELQPCSDPDALRMEEQHLGLDPDMRAELDKVFELRDAGRYKAEMKAASDLLAKARERKNREGELDALLALAMAQDELEVPEAGKTFDEVSALAETLGRDVEAASAYASMAADAARDRQDYTAAHRDLALARAKLARMGGKNESIRGDLFVIEAKIFIDEFRFGEAERACRQGVIALESALGMNNPKVGIAVGTLSQILRAEQKNDEALEASRRTLDIFEHAYGPDHPTTAGSRLNLATSLIDYKKYDEARQLLVDADAVFARVYGPYHPARAAVAGNLGSLEQLEEHWDAALVADRRALTIIEHTVGPDSADASGARRDVAKVLALSNHIAEAAEEQQRAIAILDKMGADGEPRLIGALSEMAEIDLTRNRKPAAIEALKRALATAAKRPADADPDELAHARELLGQAQGPQARR